PHRSVAVDQGPERTIPNLHGGITGREAAPNRRGAELAGLARDLESTGGRSAISSDDLLTGDAATQTALLVVCDSAFGAAAFDPETVARLRQAKQLIVFGWADSPLAQAADVVLPVATHAEKEGTFVNCESRVQRFSAAFPSPAQVRTTVDVLSDLLSRFDAKWANLEAPAVFDQLAAELPAFAGLTWRGLHASGAPLATAHTPPPDSSPEALAHGATA